MKRLITRQVSFFTAVFFTAVLVLVALPIPPVSGQEASEGSSVRDQIEDINEEVNDKKQELVGLNQKVEQYKSAILGKKAESAELKDQMGLLDSKIARTQLSIDITKREIEGIELEIGSLGRRIAEKEEKIEREKVLLGVLMRKLYGARFNRSEFEILFSHDSLSEFFDEIRALSDMQGGLNRAVAKLKGIHAQLEEEKEGRELKRQALSAKQRELFDEKQQLDDDRALKNAVLAETEFSELRYRYLLAELKYEQSQADAEIAYLEKVLRSKMDIADRLGGGETVLSWPIVPERGISSGFHDPEYPYRHIFEHSGIDIRAYQGTPIRAAASGIVARAKDGGYGYSYIMLIHNNDISTVYGHVSGITAREDTFVERGEIIGYSGGMPGTSGAGRLTTGPHLHFETRLRGIPTDPLQYLTFL